MTPLTSRQLRHRITIRRSIQEKDGKGGYTSSWTTIASPMAELLGLAGRESVMERVLEGVSSYRVRIRWRAGLVIKASDQILLSDGTELNITAPAADPDGKRQQLIIMAETQSAEKTV